MAETRSNNTNATVDLALMPKKYDNASALLYQETRNNANGNNTPVYTPSGAPVYKSISSNAH